MPMFNALGQPYHVLYEDELLIAVNKPPLLPSTGRTLDDPRCLQYQLMQDFGQKLWAVHQLDADTSGVNLFVKQKRGVAHYQKRMQHPDSRKRYLALTHNAPQFSYQRVDKAIGKRDDPKFKWGLSPIGKHAVSHFRMCAHNQQYACFEVDIETGRTHQIRVHLQHLGHPLLGEPWYIAQECMWHERHTLHAWQMILGDGEFPHQFEAPIRPDLIALANALSLPLPDRPSPTHLRDHAPTSTSGEIK